MPDVDLAHPDLRRFFSAHADGHAFERTFAGSAFERAGRSRMARNAVIVLANSGDPDRLGLVRLAAADIDPIVRATAAHALVRLGDIDATGRLVADADAMVAAEARAAMGAVSPTT